MSEMGIEEGFRHLLQRVEGLEAWVCRRDSDPIPQTLIDSILDGAEPVEPVGPIEPEPQPEPAPVEPEPEPEPEPVDTEAEPEQ